MGSETDFLAAHSWRPGTEAPSFDAQALSAAVGRIREPLHLVRGGARGPLGVAFGGELESGRGGFEWVGRLPALYPEWLGDRAFCEAHGVRFPVRRRRDGQRHRHDAHGRSRWPAPACSASSAPAGLVPAGSRRPSTSCRRALGRDGRRLGLQPDPLARTSRRSRTRVADLLPAPRRAPRLGLGLHGPDAGGRALRATGLPRRRRDGRHRRAEPRLRQGLAARGGAPRSWRRRPRELLERAGRARASSPRTRPRSPRRCPSPRTSPSRPTRGGHTDNRPLAALFPAILGLRDELAAQHGYARPIRVGAAGGLGTPGASPRPSRWAPPTC